MQTVSHNDPRLIWEGAVSVEYSDKWAMPWRLPFKDLEFYPHENLQLKASLPSSVRLRFITDATEIIFNTAVLENDGNADLYADGKLVSTQAFKNGDTKIAFGQIPQGKKLIELWPNQKTAFRLNSLQISDGAEIFPADDKRPKWITYGSSITHCAAAGSPSFTWPGVVARKKGLNLTSLGFGGECHADPMIARLIRDLPADMVSVKLGINIYGNGSLNQRSFLPAIIGTISTIREKHPHIPFIVCSPVWSPDREDTPNTVGLTLKIMREQISHAVSLFRKRGDENIHYVDGLKLFGPELASNLPDKLHPDAEGYIRLGENFFREVFEVLKIEV